MTDQTGDAGPDIRRQIAEYGAELMRFREMLDLAFAGGARSSKSPEDRVVFPLLVSCRDIVEEILFALNDGFGRAALRSARTMYECVVTARYLNLHPERPTISWLCSTPNGRRRSKIFPLNSEVPPPCTLTSPHMFRSMHRASW